MTTTYATAIKNQTSQKIVIADARFRKQFFAWVEDDPPNPGVYYQESTERVTAVRENDVDLGAAEASKAALISAVVTIQGAWYWEWSTGRLWYKPVTSTNAPDNFVLCDIQFRWSNYEGEDSENLPVDPIIVNVPRLNTRTGEIFDQSLGQTGSGSLSIAQGDGASAAAVQQLFARVDFEPDGQVTLTESIATFGGV